MSSSMSDSQSRKRKALDGVDLTPAGAPPPIQCPYMDTIQRSVLDFDLEPACSVSLVTSPHIYACLVCGKYFRGRGLHTPAYTHSVEESHFVFLHLTKATFHCLHDIRDALHPAYDIRHLARLDSNTELSRDLFGRLYLPGFVGLNNLHKTDGINAVVQALVHVRPLRDYFLRQSIGSSSDAMQHQQHQHRAAYSVTFQFGTLVRQLWSDRRFKSHVDPHMFVNAVSAASHKKFGGAGKQVDAGEFLAWFLRQLHLGTGGGIQTAAMAKKKKKKQHSSSQQPTSIVEKIFQGRVRVTTRQAKRKSSIKSNLGDVDEDDRGGSDDDEDDVETKDSSAPNTKSQIKIEETTIDTQFLQLTLDISEKPLFRDEDGGLVIPQEPLVTVLKKFDGVTFADVLTRNGVVQRRRYALQRLPDYLILHLARFKNNQYSREKNPTIVAFPVKNLDLTDYVQPPKGGRPVPPTAEEVQKMSVRYLPCPAWFYF